MNHTNAHDQFETFLVLMDEQLEALREEAIRHAFPLDSSLADLAPLEHLFDKMSAGLDKDATAGLVVTFARHLGEIVRIALDGTWHLPLDDPRNVNFNTPVVVRRTAIDGPEFAPISVMRAYALRRKPGTLRRAADAFIQVDAKPLDLSDLIED